MIIEEYMTVRGWDIRENKPHRIMYTGLFKAKDREWQGRILVTSNNEVIHVRPFILDPPGEIKNIREGKCFRLVGNSWFDLHWEKPPQTASDCLIYMEGLLSKALDSQ